MKVKVLKLDEVPTEELQGGGSVQRIITKTTTGMDISFSQARLSPGTRHRWHTHEGQDEAVFVLQGNGTMSFEDQQVNYGPGTAIVIPRGMKHRNVNTGTKDVILLAIFNPPLR